MAFPRPSRRMVSCATATVLVISGTAVALTLYAPDASASGTLLFSQPFNDNTVDGTAGSVSVPAVQSGTNAACLTAAGNPTANPLASCPTATDTQGSGTLRFTSLAGSTVGAAFAGTGVPTSQGLDVTFSSYQYGGTGADGIAFVLAAVNPADPQTPATAGPSGGSLGYSANPASSANGLADGYIGIGLDAYGNFSSTYYQGSGCTNPAYIRTGGAVPGQVVVRGPGNGPVGYCALASTATTISSAALALRASTRAASLVPVEVVLNPASSSATTASGLVVPGGDYDVTFTPAVGTARSLVGVLPVVPSGLYPASWVNANGIPKQLAFGWLGSTGGQNDFHEISNVIVNSLSPVPSLAVSQTSYAGSSLVAGSPVTYQLAASSSGAAENSPVTVTETLPSGVVPVGASGTGWVCGAPSGQQISCTDSTSPFTSGTITVNGVVTSGSMTAAAIASGTTAVASSSDADTATSSSAPAGTVPSAPAVTGVSPSSGAAGGNNDVTVSGTNLGGATAIEIGTAAQFTAGTPATLNLCASSAAGCFTVTSTTSLDISSMPAHAAGAVTVKVVSLGISGTSAYTYNAGPALLFSAPPGGEAGVAYSDQLTVTGGTSPYTWSVSTGTLPANLTLGSSTGLLSGTPATAGSYSFTVEVTDSASLSATKPVSLTIVAGPSLSFPAPPAGLLHTVYGDTLTESGGTSPFAWSVSSGSLPAGISLSADGTLTGTPTATGTFSFTVKVTDADNQSATEATSVMVTLSRPITVAAGNIHSCEIRSGLAYCWGDNSNGELGNGSTMTSSVPVAVWTGGLLSGVSLIQITTGTNFSCALSSAGVVSCWGLGTSGQLGNNSTASSSLPVAVYTGGVLAGLTVTQITARGASACALASTGAAYCWGAGGSGQLGNGTTTTAQSKAVAVTVTGGVLSGVNLTGITSGSAFACALASTGVVFCWGAGSSGQLGNGTTTATQSTAVAVTTSGVLSGVTVTQLEAGSSSSCALSSAGAAYCWGGGGNGQLGNGTTTATQSTAVTVTATGVLTGLTLTQITVGATFVCTLGNTGAAFCWGANSNGQDGNPATAVNPLVPVAVTSEPTMIASGYEHACLLRNGKAYCWGDDSFGELGNSIGTGNFTSPVAVTVGGSSAIPTGTTLIQITTANLFTCALASTGYAYCWGDNSKGQLGDGGTSTSDVPVLVEDGGTSTQISVGTNFACALTSAGAAYCWGANTNGQMGDNTGGASGDTQPTPTAVTVGSSGSAMPTGTVLTQITGGYGYACALATTGLAYCWGADANGQLGNSSNETQTLVAVAVTVGSPGLPTGTVLTQIAVTVWAGANDSTCALSTAGADYCWGDNTDGELGNGTTSTTAQTTAVAVSLGAIPAGTTLAQVTVGDNFACALSVVGAAYCWGLGTGDQLGNGGTTSSDLPVAVSQGAMPTGTILFQISSGQLATCTQDTTGAFYCWGTNTNGQLGNSSTTSSETPVIVQKIVPGAPTGVSATPGDTTATISWTAPASLGTGTLTGYTATATAAAGTFTCTTTSALTCVITGLMDGTTYSVTVATLTTDGNSPPSSPAVNVEPIGYLQLTSPTSLTWALTGNGLDQSAVDTVAGDQQLTATDNTATGVGWHIAISATTFTTGTYTLPNPAAADFTGSITTYQATTAPTATCVGSCTLPTDSTVYPVAITTAPSAPANYTVYDTASGTGENVMTIGGSTAANPIGWWVQAPASTRAGTYTSTVTLQIISAP